MLCIYICNIMCLVHHMYNIQCVIIYIYTHTLHYITLHYITLHYITVHYITLHYITLHVCSSLTKPSFWKSQPATKAATWGNQEPHTTECWCPIGLPSGFIGGCNGKSPMNEVYSWENHRTKMVWWYCFCPDPLWPYLHGQSHGFPVDVPFKSTRFSLGLKNSCGSTLDAKILDG